MITGTNRRAGSVALVLAVVLGACGSDGPDAGADARADTTVATSVDPDPPAAADEPSTTGPEPTEPESDPPITDPAPAESDPVDTDAAVAAAVDVRADGCGPRVGFGSGSVVDGGVVVTVAHVVAGADDVEVIATDGRRTPARVVLFDPDLDFAVLRPDEPVGTPVPIRADDSVAGERGVVVLARRVDGLGGSEGDTVEVEIAEVSVVRTARITTTDIYLEDEVVRDGFEIEGSIDPGDSGGLVVLPGGGAGVVWARSNRDERRAWGIDLPPVVLDGSAAELDGEVDTGPCIR